MNRKRWMRTMCTLAVLGIGLFVPIGASDGATITQNFDSDPADWVGVNNMVGLNNFGFSNTNNVGLGAGEAGGLIARDADTYVAHYSTNVGTLDPSSDAISFSGTAVFKAPHFDYSFIGYFTPSAGTAFGGGYPANFLGLYSDDRNITVYAFDNGHVAGSAGAGQPALDAPWTFNLTYDPSGNGGNGAVTGTVNSVAINIGLDPGEKDNFLDFTNFGMHGRNNGNANRASATFMDGLSYTSEVIVIPEPASSVLILLVVAGASVRRKPWRKGDGSTFDGARR